MLKVLENEDHENYIARGVDRAESFLMTQTKGSIRQREDRLKQHLLRQGYAYEDISIIINTLNDDYSKEAELDSLKDIMHKSYNRYERRYEGKEIKNRMIRHALSKGYDYDMIMEVMKEFENEN